MARALRLYRPAACLYKPASPFPGHCTVDLKVGGAYRYVWRNAEGTEMGMGGIYREVVPSERIVATESFDDPWYPGEATPMEEGVATSYDRLAELLATSA